MYRPAVRAASAATAIRTSTQVPVVRRFISTAPPHQKSRSWKSSAVRWGLAGAVVYYYNTASVFAEEPAFAVHSPPQTSRENENLATIDAIAEQRRAQRKATPPPAPTQQAASVTAAEPAGAIAESPAAELEEEAGQQGAFNEETGEINWDCPCLGGMATGPCGDQFKAAFSCFVYSKEEPKGVECIEHFKTMQNCFREHPDVYGSELEDDEAPPPETLDGPVDAPTGHETPYPSPAAARSAIVEGQQSAPSTNSPSGSSARERAEAATAQVQRDHGPQSEAPEVVPKAWHDSRSS